MSDAKLRHFVSLGSQLTFLFAPLIAPFWIDVSVYGLELLGQIIDKTRHEKVETAKF